MNSEMAYSNSPSSILHAQTRCKSVHARGFTLDKKTVENQDWATGPSGRWAAGPWQAVGRGPLGCGPAFSKTPLVTMIKTSARSGFFFFDVLSIAYII